MSFRDVVRWVLVAVLTGFGTLAAVLFVAGYAIQDSSCVVRPGVQLPSYCGVIVQIIPLIFLVLWIALNFYFIRKTNR